MSVNLESLKREILAYLENSEFAVFHGAPRCLEGVPAAAWDVERFPDYRAFLEVARKAGVTLVLFASAEFEGGDVDELEERIEETDWSAEDRRLCQKRLRDFRPRIGETCSLELGFDHKNRFYVYVVRPDWYEEFLGLEEEVMSHLLEDEGDDEDELGGYYSRN